jgi:hypothetical protein
MVTFLYRLLTVQRTGGDKKEGKQLPIKREKLSPRIAPPAEEKKKTVGRFATFLVKLFFWKGASSIDWFLDEQSMHRWSWWLRAWMGAYKRGMNLSGRSATRPPQLQSRVHTANSSSEVFFLRALKLNKLSKGWRVILAGTISQDSDKRGLLATEWNREHAGTCHLTMPSL